MNEVIDKYAREEIKWLNHRHNKSELRTIEWMNIQHKINREAVKYDIGIGIALLATIVLSTIALAVALAK